MLSAGGTTKGLISTKLIIVSVATLLIGGAVLVRYSYEKIESATTSSSGHKHSSYHSPTSLPSTWKPTHKPSGKPTIKPTHKPSGEQTISPSQEPSLEPSGGKSVAPSSEPSVAPSFEPSFQPSIEPSGGPTSEPSKESKRLKHTIVPTITPTWSYGKHASRKHGAHHSGQTSDNSDTHAPSAEPSREPTSDPSSEPFPEPTLEPTVEPTLEPSREPSAKTTNPSSMRPTLKPTVNPSDHPSGEPTIEPTADPTKENKHSRSSSSETTELTPTGHPTAPNHRQPPTKSPTSEPTSESGSTGNHHKESPTSAPSTTATEDSFCTEFDDDNTYTGDSCGSYDSGACNHCLSGFYCDYFCGTACESGGGAVCAMEQLCDMETTCATAKDLYVPSAWSSNVYVTNTSLANKTVAAPAQDPFGSDPALQSLAEEYGCDNHVYCEFCIGCDLGSCEIDLLSDREGYGPSAMAMLNNLSYYCASYWLEDETEAQPLLEPHPEDPEEVFGLPTQTSLQRLHSEKTGLTSITFVSPYIALFGIMLTIGAVVLRRRFLSHKDRGQYLSIDGEVDIEGI